MNIVILDSGCDLSIKALEQYVKYIDLYIYDKSNCKITQEINTEKVLFHGSIVTRIILDNSEKNNLKLSIFRIFDENSVCNASVLISALSYIYQNIDCDIIHMSLGVRTYNKELEKICYQLYKKGIIIVSAFDNAGAVSYPAGFDFVIGVVGSLRCQLSSDYVVLYNSIIDFKAKIGMQQQLEISDGSKILDAGNSLAAPYITALINNLNPKTNNIFTIKQLLENNAKYVYKYTKKNKFKRPQIKKAAVFPFNKETQNILNYEEELYFEVVDFYDIKYLGNLGRNHTSIFSGRNFVIKDYMHIDWNSFDTLIIGHLEELSVLCKKNIKKEILDKCLLENKNVFCFDDFEISEYRDLFLQKSLMLFCPNDCMIPNPKLGMLYQFITPILTVFGTSKKQGKFTLQLEIRKVLKNHGIDVGQIGTEPNSILFGMDRAVPFGYFGIRHSNSEMIELINSEVNIVDRENHDIIVIGSQSGFGPERYYNTRQIMLEQYSLLFAAPPDGVILAVNIQDPISLIHHTIESIESIGNTKVFLLALYAFDVTYDYIINSKKQLLTKKQIDEFRAKVKKHFNLDVIVTGEIEDSEKLFNSIITYFCGDK